MKNHEKYSMIRDVWYKPPYDRYKFLYGYNLTQQYIPMYEPLRDEELIPGSLFSLKAWGVGGYR